jgi:hypothetical protein
MRVSVRQKIISVCDAKVRDKGANVGVSFFAFIRNTNDDPELLMEAARWWIHTHVRNMLTFVDLFRHGGARNTTERLQAMANVMPTRAFGTMAVAQICASLLLPAIAVLVMMGVTSVLGIALSRAVPLFALAGGLAFTGVLFLQVFIALVDVMLHDLAYDMTEA